MVKAEIKVTVGDKNKSPAEQLKRISRGLDRYLSVDVSRMLVGDYKETTSNWSSGPSFESDYKAFNVSKRLTVKPVGRGRTKWGWVSDGTGPRIIRAKRPNKKMRFRRKYSPKTTPSGRYGGAGRKFGPVVLASSVRHSTAPRNFSYKIVEKRGAQIIDGAQRVIRRSVR